MKNVVFCTLIFFAYTLSAKTTQTAGAPRFVGFVGLMPLAAYENLEARVNCGLSGSPVSDSCKRDKLKVNKWELTVFAEPSEKSTVIGKIEVVIDPEDYRKLSAHAPDSKLRAYFVKGSKRYEIRMDLNEMRANLFKITVKSVKGDWIELPSFVSEGVAWINIKRDWGVNIDSSLHPIGADEIYSHPDYDEIEIIKVEKDFIQFKKSAGINCDPESQTKSLEPIKKVKQVYRKPIAEFYDFEGRLRLSPAYPMGC